jgi:hypothetical protein
MGARGPRSAADLTAFRHEGELTPIDVEALARHYGDSREALRALRRAERHGQAVSRTRPDGSVEWYSTH